MNLRRRLSDEGGVVMPLVAAASVTVLAMTSLTVDVGRVANRNRDLQAIADVVAVDAAGALTGADIDELPDTDFLDAVVASAARNGFDTDPAVTPGRFDPLTGFTAGGTPTNAWRLVADDGVQLDVAVGAGDLGEDGGPGEALDLVGVWLRDRVDFAFGVGAVDASRTARAEATPGAGTGIGTRLLALGDDAGDPALLNELLGKLLGVEIDVLSYEGLAGAGVTLGELAVNLGAASVEQLVGLDVGVADFLLAAAEVLQLQGDIAGAELLETLRVEVGGSLTVPLGELVTVGLGGAVAAASAELDALGLVTAVAMIAGQGHAVSLDAGVLGVPGLGVPVGLTVIEPPQVAFGAEGTAARTAQIAVTLAPTVTPDVDLGLVRLATVAEVPVAVAVAPGEATISNIDCDPDPTARSVEVAAATTGAGVTADVVLDVDLTIDPPLLPAMQVADVGVSVDLDAAVAASNPAPVTFSDADHHPYGEVVTVGGGEVNLVDVGSAIVVDEAKLVGLDLSGIVGGLAEVVTTVVNGVTDFVLTPVNAIVAGVLTVLDGVLGLGLAEADVTATAPVCDAGRLIA